MIIYIKNMVCVRCKMVVQMVLEELQIDYVSIELGKVTLVAALNPDQQKNSRWLTTLSARIDG